MIGYTSAIENIREIEYPQLSTENCFLDHAGTTLYPQSLISLYSKDLLQDTYGNPHAKCGPSQRTNAAIQKIRRMLLRELFHDYEATYDLVFTSGATASIKLVGELMTSLYSGSWQYLYSSDAHTSLVGLRELAEHWEVFDQRLPFAIAQVQPALIAWAGRSNFSGRMGMRKCGVSSHTSSIYTLLDAASLVATAPLYLTTDGPDFIALSFYKMFGFPTGLGALLVKKSKPVANLVQCRKYFSGGTVEAVSSKTDYHVSKGSDTEFHSSLEDGTSNFLSIIALNRAFHVYKTLFGPEPFLSIAEHVSLLSLTMVSELNSLRHFNGSVMVDLLDYTAGSPIIAMTLTKSTGGPLGYSEIMTMSSILGIHFRAGTLCNPGESELHLGLGVGHAEEMYLKGHRCSEEQDLLSGKHTGALRVSFGASSSGRDVAQFVSFLREYFLESLPRGRSFLQHSPSLHRKAKLSKVFVYPIKSCQGYQVEHGESWNVHECGLQYDRQWAIVNLENFRALSQKDYTQMALIETTIDKKCGYLHVKVANQTLNVLLEPSSIDLEVVCTVMVCGDPIKAHIYKDSKISHILSNFLGVSCALSFSGSDTDRFVKHEARSWSALKIFNEEDSPRLCAKRKVLFSNESPFLCISLPSVDALRASTNEEISTAAFRANFEISSSETESLEPFEEDSWTALRLADCEFEVLGKCRRCRMLAIDQVTGCKIREPYAVLQKYRKAQGKLYFGIHLALVKGSSITVGQTLQMDS